MSEGMSLMMMTMGEEDERERDLELSQEEEEEVHHNSQVGFGLVACLVPSVPSYVVAYIINIARPLTSSSVGPVLSRPPVHVMPLVFFFPVSFILMLKVVFFFFFFIGPPDHTYARAATYMI